MKQKEWFGVNKINIVGIAPFNGLKLSMEQVAAKFPTINFDCYVGDLNAGLEIIDRLDLENIDVIISRGGTALLIKDSVNIPVIEIDITVYDIMRSVKLSQNLNGKLALVGFKNITDKAYLLNDLMEMKLDIVSVDAAQNAENVLIDLKKRNYEVIISDQVTSTLARDIGLTAILITSVEESISKSFEQALSIGQTYAQIKQHRYIYKSLYEKSPIDILVFNKKNHLIEEYSNYSLPSKIKNKIIQLNSDTKKVIPPFKEMHADTIFLIQNIYDADTNFFVYYVKVIDKINDNNTSIELIDVKQNIDDSLLSNSSLSIGINEQQKQHLNNYAKTQHAILFIGEKGTGKDKLAHLVASYSIFSRMWQIDCKSISTKNWDNLFLSANSPIYDDSIIIHFKNLNSLTTKQLLEFINFAENSLLFNRNKIILSYSIASNESTQNLISHFNEWPIIFYTTMPLRENKPDLPAIAALYINEFNAIYGKQVIGFEPNALERLVEFDWPLNQTQFKRVIEQLIIKTNGLYIKDEDTLGQLKKELNHIHSVTQNILQLDQTLDEINNDIIQLVLAEEQGNKTNTAKRLGISRSTLWRLEKKHNNN